MLNKLQKFSPYIIVTLLVFVFSTQQTHANVASWLGITFPILDVIDYVFGAISQLALYIMHFLVTATAALFSVSINLNLHIKAFVDATTGVYLVWRVVRDVCSLFIIFMLLYTAIRMILSQEGLNSVGNLLKNIVIGGILINFSFFITSLLIDASNMVSLAIYKGIVTNDSTGTTAGTGSSCITNSATSQNPATKCLVDSILDPKSAGSDASLGDFFLAKLSPQKIYNLTLTDGGGLAKDVPDDNPAPLRTLVQGVVGSVIMFTVSMSFLFASIAFASRLVILVVMLAFSSIWFASWIFPALKSRSDDYWNLLKGQLIFMPVYLLLLYGALVVLNNSTIFQSPNAGTSATDLSWFSGYIVLAINDFFIIFLLNLPLVTAFTFAQSSTNWMNAGRFSAKNVWKGVGLTSGSFAGRHTVGRAAYIANNSGVMKSLTANSPFIGNIVSKRLDKVSNAGFGQKKGGFKDVTEQYQKDYKARYEDVGKASAAERAMYDNTEASRNEETGKTDLDRFLDERKDKYFKAISKPTVISSVINSVKNATESVVKKVSYPTDVAEGYVGKTSVTEAVGSAVTATAKGVNMAGTNVAASFSASESAAMGEIKKMREAEQKKNNAIIAKAKIEKQQEENEKLDEQFEKDNDTMDTETEQVEKNITNINEQISKATEANKKLTTQINDTHKKDLSEFLTKKEEEANKLRELIKINSQTILNDKSGITIKNPSVIKAEEELSKLEEEIKDKRNNSDMELKTKLSFAELANARNVKTLADESNSLKIKKDMIKRSKMQMKEQRTARQKEFNMEKRRLQSSIDEAKSIETKEQTDQLVSTIKASGSGGSAPTPPKPTT